jgi:3'-phosphoadenosine 5'-phosphosulfate sulfotransferase (PAPS reductase)/FAD synthetase
VFLQGIIYHRSAPTRLRKWCTSELKIRPIAKHLSDILFDNSKKVYMWQGIRKDESLARQKAVYMDEDPSGYTNIRPILDWTAEDVFALHRKEGIAPNPLYKKGMGRVGCMPCINATKKEMREIALRYPDVLEKMDEYERIIAICNPTYEKPSFFYNQTTRERGDWSLGKGNQIGFFDEEENIPACSSQYGLCE